MVSTELGTKRTCPSCAARFYDLTKNPAVCPKCATVFVAETVLPSKGESAHHPKPRPAPVPIEAEEEVADVELVSLDEVDDGTDDDEVAAIEDVDLGEDVAVDDARVVRDGNAITGGGVTAGIDIALTIAAELAGDDVAKMIQLAIEYAPAPPFNCGRPETADEKTIAAVKQLFSAFAQQRREAIETMTGAA